MCFIIQNNTTYFYLFHTKKKKKDMFVFRVEEISRPHNFSSGFYVSKKVKPFSKFLKRNFNI